MKKGNVTAVLPFRWMHAFDYFVCRETHGIPMIKGVSGKAQKDCFAGGKCGRCFIITRFQLISITFQYTCGMNMTCIAWYQYRYLICFSFLFPTECTVHPNTSIYRSILFNLTHNNQIEDLSESVQSHVAFRYHKYYS